ncbi:hypothetical protein D3C84_1057760 [compost metagenome]
MPLTGDQIEVVEIEAAAGHQQIALYLVLVVFVCFVYADVADHALGARWRVFAPCALCIGDAHDPDHQRCIAVVHVLYGAHYGLVLHAGGAC